MRHTFLSWVVLGSALSGPLSPAEGGTALLESRFLRVQVETTTGRWTLVDRDSGVQWPTAGTAGPGTSPGLAGNLQPAEPSAPGGVRLVTENGSWIEWALTRKGRSVELRYGLDAEQSIEVLEDLLRIDAADGGYVIVPSREGLLVRPEGGKPFRRTFGTSDYEGCHMNMLGLVKKGSALVASWRDAYVFPTIIREAPGTEHSDSQVSAGFELRRSARALLLTPLGRGDWNTVAAAYRRIAEEEGLAVTLREKIRRSADMERLIGASDFKLWTCLARRMNEESTEELSVNVRWTFSEAAQIAEHLRRDLGIDRCLFMIGGWTEGGYDCRHPDNLPANEECGGNEALAKAAARIRSLGFVDCLHDNYQDMYRDAKSWDPAFIEKRQDGTLVRGGRWLGGRAFMVCAPKQLELAKRVQNLPSIHELFGVKSYFIDTTYAVGPRECHAAAHPIGRNEDIAWKARLSDYARDVFGLFGSECGREWALPHSDFFEGLVGVSGRYYHTLRPEEIGATVIPFWEMVYHDCQIAWGKYGYAGEQAAEYVAHHVLCARPLHYHSVPDHLYWKTTGSDRTLDVRPSVAGVERAGPRKLRIRYAWYVKRRPAKDWRVFVHFTRDDEILFQDDHDPASPTSRWVEGSRFETEARTVTVPPGVALEDTGGFNVYIGLFDPEDHAARARIPGADSQQRVLVGHVTLAPELSFKTLPRAASREAAYTRADGGWAEGLHPLDVFVKNTHEILGPLHRETAHSRLEEFALASPDGSLRRAVYGTGEEAVTVQVNFGGTDAIVTTRRGGKAVLPPWGFCVEGPRVVAFYATRWADHDYEPSALFTIRSLDGKPIAESKQVRVFHGFGDPRLRLWGNTHTIGREAALTR